MYGSSGGTLQESTVPQDLSPSLNDFNYPDSSRAPRHRRQQDQAQQVSPHLRSRACQSGLGFILGIIHFSRSLTALFLCPCPARPVLPDFVEVSFPLTIAYGPAWASARSATRGLWSSSAVGTTPTATSGLGYAGSTARVNSVPPGLCLGMRRADRYRARRLLREQIPSKNGAGRLIWNISKYNHDQSPKNLTILKSFTWIPSHTVNISKYNYVQRPKVLTLQKSSHRDPKPHSQLIT